ncbi:hypothetical protein [Alicyclobacillus kakegawensis]|uniref:hypothetical protein n=1 Tax=Alicyclobacillus kakegawensis TaxID=392012 RepID=UPI00082E6284|nr:hypothetical protein [Alicyclobacillus kakegawensis]
MDYRIADLVFLRGVHLFDRVIQRVTHSPYSHVAGVVLPGQLMEARASRRVGYVPLSAYKGLADLYTCDELNEGQRAGIRDYVLREYGYDYDYWLIGWEGVRYLLHLVLPFQEPPRTRICSTLWCEAYRSVGVDLCPQVRFPAPADLARSLRLRKVRAL